MAFSYTWRAVLPWRLDSQGRNNESYWGLTKITREGAANDWYQWHSNNWVGGNGNSVVVIQQKLNNALNYWRAQGHPGVPASNLTTDGVIGAKSDTAIRFYQSVMAQTVDGIIGPSTWNLLSQE